MQLQETSAPNAYYAETDREFSKAAQSKLHDIIIHNRYNIALETTAHLNTLSLEKLNSLSPTGGTITASEVKLLKEDKEKGLNEHLLNDIANLGQLFKHATSSASVSFTLSNIQSEKHWGIFEPPFHVHSKPFMTFTFINLATQWKSSSGIHTAPTQKPFFFKPFIEHRSPIIPPGERRLVVTFFPS